MKHENKIVTLFEAENGLWGTKDAEGNVFDEPVYERYDIWEDVTHFIDYGAGIVCEFTSVGFVTIGTLGNDVGYVLKHGKFPEEYNHFIWTKLRACFCDWDEGRNIVSKVMRVLRLDDEQKRVLADIDFYFHWKTMIDNRNDIEHCTNEEWIEDHVHHISDELRVCALTPLMESARLTDEEKAVLWYGNFLVIQGFEWEIDYYDDECIEYDEDENVTE